MIRMRLSASAPPVSARADNGSAAGLAPSRAAPVVGAAPAAPVAPPWVLDVVLLWPSPDDELDAPVREPKPPVILSGSAPGTVSPGGAGVALTCPGVKARCSRASRSVL